MAQISLQSGIVYGPIFSRRLGRSFGINLLPTTRKVCSFNCVYCQYGTTLQTILYPLENEFPAVTQVISAVELALKKPRTIDYLTFSGNGEPTIHPQFPRIVKEIKAVRDRLRPEVKLGIFSNSSRVMDPDVIEAINLIDAPMMKLDAGDENTFQNINQPEQSLHLSDIVQGLKNISGLIIQSAIIDGPVSNIKGDEFQSWVNLLCELRPTEVHIYAIDRPTAEDFIVRVDGRTLKKIEELLIKKYDLKARAFWSQ